MKSQLKKRDFEVRLKEMTMDSSGVYFITSFNFSGKPLFGTFDESTFRLTRNSFWPNVRAFVIKGNYETIDTELTKVTYEVIFSNFRRNIMISFFSVTLLGLNIFLYLNHEQVTLSIFSTLNGFLIFGVLWAMVMNKIARKIVDEKFRIVFEIDDES